MFENQISFSHNQIMLSQQQLKARRRQKVLARAAQFAGEQRQQNDQKTNNVQQASNTDAFSRYRLIQKRQANRQFYIFCSKFIGALIAILAWFIGQRVRYLSQICFFCMIVIIWMLMKLNQTTNASKSQNQTGLLKNAMFNKIEQVNNILGINQYLKVALNIYASFIVTAVVIVTMQALVGSQFVKQRGFEIGIQGAAISQ